VQKFLISQLPPPEELYANFSPEQSGSILTNIMGFTLTSANFLGQVVSVIILSIYWSIDRFHFERLWLSLLPVDSRSRARDVWRNIERDFGAYIRSEVLQSLFAGVLLGIGLWLLGVEYPILLALFAALAWLIPWLGGVLAIIPIALTGLSENLWLGIFATLFATSVLFFLEFYIEPRFIRRRQRQFSSLLSIILIIALSKPYGLMGFLVAPPLAAAIELIFRYNLRNKIQPEVLQTVEQVSILRGRIIQIRDILSRSAEPPEPQIASLLGRLESLVDQTDRALRQEHPGQSQRLPSNRQGA
jgi:predicted PurR-regulated permease PerM